MSCPTIVVLDVIVFVSQNKEAHAQRIRRLNPSGPQLSGFEERLDSINLMARSTAARASVVLRSRVITCAERSRYSGSSLNLDPCSFEKASMAHFLSARARQLFKGSSSAARCVPTTERSTPASPFKEETCGIPLESLEEEGSAPAVPVVGTAVPCPSASGERSRWEAS